MIVTVVRPQSALNFKRPLTLGKEPTNTMRFLKTPVLAIAVSTAVLFGAVSLTSASLGQKKKSGAKPGAASAAQIASGKKVFDAHGCAACHVVGGRGGKTGPELSHIGANKKNTAARLTEVIRDPKKALNTVKMPAYPPDGTNGINDTDLKALVTYMRSLK